MPAFLYLCLDMYVYGSVYVCAFLCNDTHKCLSTICVCQGVLLCKPLNVGVVETGGCEFWEEGLDILSILAWEEAARGCPELQRGRQHGFMKQVSDGFCFESTRSFKCKHRKISSL